MIKRQETSQLDLEQDGPIALKLKWETGCLLHIIRGRNKEGLEKKNWNFGIFQPLHIMKLELMYNISLAPAMLLRLHNVILA